MSPGADRVFYFTSAVGDEQRMHDIQVELRAFDLEPCLVRELKMLANQRQNKLNNEYLIEKPKGVDIALAVHMVEDACIDLYETCHLYTSDVDFLPAIEMVKHRGKRVWVHGYKDGLSERSPLLHVPDGFDDLIKTLRDKCELTPDLEGCRPTCSGGQS